MAEFIKTGRVEPGKSPCACGSGHGAKPTTKGGACCGKNCGGDLRAQQQKLAEARKS